MEAVEALALVAGHVEEEVLLRNEYLAAVNEIRRNTRHSRGLRPLASLRKAPDEDQPLESAQPHFVTWLILPGVS